jgi:uncharacterized protein YcbK (DUF882 family)
VKLSDHFDSDEFKCPDCGVAVVNPRLIDALEGFRVFCGGKPVTILSGYRCAKDNRNAHGASHSQHMLGNAADVRVKGLSLTEMYSAALREILFFNGGIGVYDEGFIHVDVRTVDDGARWARVKGEYVGLAESGLLT